VAAQAIEITFETKVPVMGQILILEAIDFLYSLFALDETEWREEFATGREDWGNFIASAPGKVLRPENALTVEYARTGSMIEVVSGVASAVERFFEYIGNYRTQIKAHQVKQAHEKLRIIDKDILPIIDKLKKRGASQRRLDAIRDNALTYTDRVLATLMESQKLELAAIGQIKSPVHPCPTCHGTGLLP
jgi:hypothetical protein